MEWFKLKCRGSNSRCFPVAGTRGPRGGAIAIGRRARGRQVLLWTLDAFKFRFEFVQGRVPCRRQHGGDDMDGGGGMSCESIEVPSREIKEGAGARPQPRCTGTPAPRIQALPELEGLRRPNTRSLARRESSML